MESETHRSRALLLTDWTSSLSDGASAVASRGFIDQDNIPPWDTWLALMDVRFAADTPKMVLVSWVPRWATELVGEAIEVNPEACLAWAGVSGGEIVATDWV